ncbi:hypothetical protein ABE10_01195, partial [Bacillus toyonensis]|nr:hypothetical protein [Bacillus toyonensis]
EGVQQYAEGDDERDLHEEEDRDHRERGEGGGEDEAGGRDHPAGDRQAADDPLPGAVPLRLLAHPGHEEDVVVDAQGDEEDEAEQRHRRVR